MQVDTNLKKMKYLIITIVSFTIYSKAYSNECVFQGMVHPAKKTETVKKLYNLACNFYIDVFDATLNQKIKLNNVYYIENWENLDYAPNDNDDLHGLFYDREDLLVNDIYINTNSLTSAFTHDEIVEKSIIFHELIHFFIKSANFEYLSENKIDRNGLMEEIISYWAQNKYIETITKGRNNIMDYILDTNKEKNFVLKDNFIYISYLLYIISWKKFVYNAIYFLNNNTKKKYNMMINNKYLISAIGWTY